ncbi:MAG: hypothetical protein MUC74_09400 [Ideonella sp.]|nr:hypothetical protein [Ideonella sp.]
MLVAGCAGYAPPRDAVGQPIAALQQQLGPPTSTYAMSNGAKRVEFARGPMGRHTWMLDVDPGGRVLRSEQVVDPGGRVLRSEQVLTPERFAQVRDGMSADDVLRLIGRPGETRSGGYQGGEVWNWRYATNECLWFELSIIEGRAKGPAYAIDPRCDPPSDPGWN